MDNRILPCPFCGGGFEVEKVTGRHYFLHYPPAGKTCPVSDELEYGTESAIVSMLNYRTIFVKLGD